MHRENSAPASSREAQLAWAAGIFEGEGCFRFTGKRGGGAHICMTDLDVLERFAAIVGFGSLRSDAKSRGPSRKLLHYWYVQNKRDVLLLIEMFWPWLGQRRQKRARELVERLKDCHGIAGATHCRRGHEINEENTYISIAGKRQCRVCRREQRRAQRREGNPLPEAAVGPVRCGVPRARETLIHCELVNGHDGAWHSGRGPSGRWFSWKSNATA